MRWRCRKAGARFRALKMWHKWFAWYPVRVPSRKGKQRVWLETVRRKGTRWFWSAGVGWDWEYKELCSVDSNKIANEQAA